MDSILPEWRQLKYGKCIHGLSKDSKVGKAGMSS